MSPAPTPLQRAAEEIRSAHKAAEGVLLHTARALALIDCAATLIDCAAGKDGVPQDSEAAAAPGGE